MRRIAFALVACAATLTAVTAQAPGVPHGGGACRTAADCSLGGVCTQSACQCDPWWTGATCALLNLAPAVNDSLGLQVPGYHSWGGHALPDGTGTYHGFFSFMCNHSTLDVRGRRNRARARVAHDRITYAPRVRAHVPTCFRCTPLATTFPQDWTTKSSIWHATASQPEGPFALADMVAQPWSHNAYVTVNPDGGYLLWQIGTAITPPDEWRPCFGNSSSIGAPAPAPTPAPPAKVGGVWTGQMFVRSAPALTGPWTLVDAGGIALNASGTWADANGANGGNPAPFFFPNGTTLLYFTATPCPDGWGAVAPNCLGVARADHWRGPYTVVSATPITHPESEDAAVFQDPRGAYHMARARSAGVPGAGAAGAGHRDIERFRPASRVVPSA